jgi:hypothetical protein
LQPAPQLGGGDTVRSGPFRSAAQAKTAADTRHRCLGGASIDNGNRGALHSSGPLQRFDLRFELDHTCVEAAQQFSLLDDKRSQVIVRLGVARQSQDCGN